MATLSERVIIIPRKLIVDERGWFFKAITGKEENLPSHTGEVYLTTLSSQGC
jgi:dTDP-4-dehydrorhamnose 3,5-epimerase-like enzyme